MLFDDTRRGSQAGATRGPCSSREFSPCRSCRLWALGQSKSAAPQPATKPARHNELIQGEVPDVTQLQVDQAMSKLINWPRQDLFNAKITYRTKLDELRMQTGLPPDVPIVLDQHSVEPHDRKAQPAKQSVPQAKERPAGAEPRACAAGTEKKQLKVRICQAIEREVRDYEDLPGVIEPVQSVQLRARVSGHIVAVECHPGQTVQKGAILFKIDPRSYRLVLAKAEAEVR